MQAGKDPAPSIPHTAARPEPSMLGRPQAPAGGWGIGLALLPTHEPTGPSSSITKRVPCPMYRPRNQSLPLAPSHARDPLTPRTYSSTQWAAVTIHSGVMMEPPQTWVPCTCRLTCQGQSPGDALLPPTIRLWRIVFPATPHSESDKHRAVGTSGADPPAPSTSPARLLGPCGCLSVPLVWV